MAVPGPEGPFWPNQGSLDHDRRWGLAEKSGPHAGLGLCLLLPHATWGSDYGGNPQTLE